MNPHKKANQKLFRKKVTIERAYGRNYAWCKVKSGFNSYLQLHGFTFWLSALANTPQIREQHSKTFVYKGKPVRAKTILAVCSYQTMSRKSQIGIIVMFFRISRVSFDRIIAFWETVVLLKSITPKVSLLVIFG